MSALDGQIMRGLNVVVRPDGREVHLDDIRTAAEGATLLDEMDASIIAIETQIASVEAGTWVRDPGWLPQATKIVRTKRCVRPKLQQRIAALKKAEKAAAAPPPPVQSPKNSRRQAFVLAAEELLDHELMVTVWERARELRPAAFAGEAQS